MSPSNKHSLCQSEITSLLQRCGDVIINSQRNSRFYRGNEATQHSRNDARSNRIPEKNLLSHAEEERQCILRSTTVFPVQKSYIGQNAYVSMMKEPRISAPAIDARWC